MDETTEENVVSDNCEDCDEIIWYDANAAVVLYCDDEDLSIEHECDIDYEDDEEYDED